MAKKLVIVVFVFLAVRVGTIALYGHHQTYYYYGQVAGQFAIAEAKWNGLDFSFDRLREQAAKDRSYAEQRFIPISEWQTLPKGTYETFPVLDLPGYGYLIAWTSRIFSRDLTSVWAHGVQVFAECLAVILFAWSLARLFSHRMALIAGLGYALAYPMIWAQASQPMRDVFFVPITSLVVFAFAVFRSQLARERFIIPLAIGLASLLLWVRPSAYFIFFLITPLAVFTPERTWRERAVFVGVLVAIPIAIYSVPVRSFNQKYYGTNHLYFIGRGLWEGLGIIPDNPYGFALDDRVLVDWARTRGVNAPYGSAEMNKALSDYAIDVVRKHPGYYLKTLLVRAKIFAKTPLDFVPPRPVAMRDKATTSIFAYVTTDPVGYFYNLLSIYSFVFLWIGLPAALLWILRERSKWWEILLAHSPLIYTVGAFFPLNHEPRYMAAGAWCVLATYAHYADVLLYRLAEYLRRSQKGA